MKIVLRRHVLREHIARRCLTQNGFAIKAGVSSGYMAQMLNGKREPAPPVQRQLLTASGLQFDDLFQIIAEPSPTEPDLIVPDLTEPDLTEPAR